jgi:hypothetical protein
MQQSLYVTKQLLTTTTTTTTKQLLPHSLFLGPRTFPAGEPTAALAPASDDAATHNATFNQHSLFLPAHGPHQLPLSFPNNHTAMVLAQKLTGFTGWPMVTLTVLTVPYNNPKARQLKEWFRSINADFLQGTRQRLIGPGCPDQGNSPSSS